MVLRKKWDQISTVARQAIRWPGQCFSVVSGLLIRPQVFVRYLPACWTWLGTKGLGHVSQGSEYRYIIRLRIRFLSITF
jgi:hypothetical protein